MPTFTTCSNDRADGNLRLELPRAAAAAKLGPVNPWTLFIGLLAGALGMAYLIYGKRQAKFSAIIAGLVLCIYPYFVDSLLWLCVIGAALAIAPFFLDF